MNFLNQELYNQELNYYYELEKRLGLIKDDKEKTCEVDKEN